MQVLEEAAVSASNIATMKAVVRRKYGDPDVLVIGEVGMPVPGAVAFLRHLPCAPSSLRKRAALL